MNVEDVKINVEMDNEHHAHTHTHMIQRSVSSSLPELLRVRLLCNQ